MPARDLAESLEEREKKLSYKPHTLPLSHAGRGNIFRRVFLFGSRLIAETVANPDRTGLGGLAAQGIPSGQPGIFLNQGEKISSRIVSFN